MRRSFPRRAACCQHGARRVIYKYSCILLVVGETVLDEAPGGAEGRDDLMDSPQCTPRLDSRCMGL